MDGAGQRRRGVDLEIDADAPLPLELSDPSDTG
jgi:hypothetical protein